MSQVTALDESMGVEVAVIMEGVDLTADQVEGEGRQDGQHDDVTGLLPPMCLSDEAESSELSANESANMIKTKRVQRYQRLRKSCAYLLCFSLLTGVSYALLR